MFSRICLVGTGWQKEGVSPGVPLWKGCGSLPSGVTQAEKLISAWQFGFVGFFGSESHSTTCKCDTNETHEMYGVLWMKYCCCACLVTQGETHTLPHPGVQHRIPLNCTGTESTDPSDIIYTKSCRHRGQREQAFTFHTSVYLKAFSISGTVVASVTMVCFSLAFLHTHEYSVLPGLILNEKLLLSLKEGRIARKTSLCLVHTTTSQSTPRI